MRRMLLIAAMIFGLTGTHAQTVPDGVGSTTSAGADPLSVPTSTLPTGSGTAGSAPAGLAGGTPSAISRRHVGNKRFLVEPFASAFAIAGRNTGQLFVANGDVDRHSG